MKLWLPTHFFKFSDLHRYTKTWQKQGQSIYVKIIDKEEKEIKIRNSLLSSSAEPSMKNSHYPETAKLNCWRKFSFFRQSEPVKIKIQRNPTSSSIKIKDLTTRDWQKKENFREKQVYQPLTGATGNVWLFSLSPCECYYMFIFFFYTNKLLSFHVKLKV